MHFDDSDMKIVGEHVTTPPDDRTQDDWQRHLENGNLDKAKALGVRLAEQVLSLSNEAEPFLTQGRILCVFAVLVGLESTLPVGLPVQTARSTFYDVLQQQGMYDSLCAAGALSFYYLCLGEGDAVEDAVGDTYARLCQQETAAVKEAGKTLYRTMLSAIQAQVTEDHFVA